MLSRKQDKLFAPPLTLKGFGWKEHEKFLLNWKITTEQWFEYEEEMREIKGKLREAQEYGAPLIDLESFDHLTEGWGEDKSIDMCISTIYTTYLLMITSTKFPTNKSYGRTISTQFDKSWCVAPRRYTVAQAVCAEGAVTKA
jgi:hypothetical protein